MKLIGTTTSPYVRKVRVVLNEKKIDYVFLLEDLSASDSTLSEFNPLGKVPCLVMEDGKILYDSSVIVEYLDTITPVGKLFPPGGRARADVKCWEALADGVMDAAVLARLEETKRPKEQQSAAWVQHQLGKVHSGLKAMSQQLGEKNWCHDNTYSLADIAVGCALGWLSFRFDQIDWQSDYENLVRLFERLSERASFQETIPV
ncbi:glutathione S-transferase N-terminal domain-containing protein [Oxalobacter vibrioformis]|uniref:Glutathione S-transferase N-terminal domain-containing protein n=1 Tax=Oxalobacter vibrioformis TaxID=933080 RepID=A0A9E9LWG1_9BURK|nr:glutathione S-transferase N-terminal domain-containing protein [Oxalobacter vibrioformis]WAW11015.1 glutathione S-transferase N-terminal domain-containing protein [Oxalobacter vibrioformis]